MIIQPTNMMQAVLFMYMGLAGMNNRMKTTVDTMPANQPIAAPPGTL